MALLQQQHGALADTGAEALGQARGHVLVLGVVDDVLGLDDIARDLVQAAETVGQPERDRLLAAPGQAAEELGRFLFEPFARPSRTTAMNWAWTSSSICCA